MHKVVVYILILLTLLAKAEHSYAQPRGNDTILLGGIVVGKDTFAMVFLDDFDLVGKLPRHLAKQREAYNRLRYNIYKVYPYAIIAAEVLKDVDVNLAKYEDDRKKRKEYLKSIEKELNRRFKGELENMTISQGQLLVKLINRQTGKNCYGIIKELKGGFSAVVWQSVALLFNNSLKREYDPYDRDKEIENIVVELEANYYYKYKYQRQNALIQQSRRKT